MLWTSSKYGPLKYLCYSSLLVDKPVCADHQKMVYGVAHGEIASINCSVRANPAAGLAFTWTFNSSSELNTLPDNRFRTVGSTSQVGHTLAPNALLLPMWTFILLGTVVAWIWGWAG